MENLPSCSAENKDTMECSVPLSEDEGGRQAKINSFHVFFRKYLKGTENTNNQERFKEALSKAKCNWQVMTKEDKEKYKQLAEEEQKVLNKMRKNDKYICPQCQREFARTKSLKLHQRECGQFFNCDICSKTFSARRNLMEHVSKVHFQKRLFPCNTCEKNFSSRSHLKRHLKNVHKS